MNDDVVRLSVVGQVIRRRWRVLVAAAVLGALLGYLVSLVVSPGYQASSQVLMQGSREADEMLTESQIAVSSTVLERAAAALRWDDPVRELRDDVTAEVVEGNVIEIRATDDDPRRAQALADQVAKEFVSYSSQLASSPANASAQVIAEQRNALQVEVRDSLRKLTALHRELTSNQLTSEEVDVRTELEQVRNALTGAVEELEEAKAAGTATNAVIVEPAEVPSSPAPPSAWQLTAAGALAGFLIGVAAHLIAARADRRVRDATTIASAFGARPVGEVTVDEHHEHRANGSSSLRRRLARLLGTDRPWQTPDGEVTGPGRYQRILAKLRTGQGVPLRLLVVIADDDPDARAVAQRLIAEAHDAVVAGNGHSTEAIGLSHPPVAQRPTLRLAEVSARQPDVPEDHSVSGALLITSAGRRTDWELVALAEACRDTGHRLAGVVVARPVRAAGRPPDDRTDAAAGHELVGAS